MRTAIIGVAESDYGKVPNRSELDLHAQAAKRALEDCGLSHRDVDGVFTVTQDFIRSPSQTVCEYLGLRPTYEDCTSVGGSSFEVLVEHAMAALQARRIDVALITYGSTMLSSMGRTLGTRTRPISSYAQQYEVPFGVSIVSSYAMAAQRHMHLFGTTPEQLARIAVAARQHAQRNPLAMYRKDLSVDDVLSSRMVSSPLHKLDCCVISDGGGALVLTREDRARDRPKPPVWVLGASHSTDHQIITEMPDLTTTAAAVTGPRAMQEAGITPADVDLLMTYDSFTITVLLALEDLGFCRKGEGGAFVNSGAIDPGARLAVNTDGGGLSSNHPGMRGIFLLIEAVRQLRGEAGERQIGKADIAVAHGVGGWLSSHGTVVLGRA
ncbi:MAG: thiolase [Acetobacteraceae bacterium]|nr:thiolase [Acetobacteraceae bacterium]